jgi:Uma2 family endonuclease
MVRSDQISDVPVLLLARGDSDMTLSLDRSDASLNQPLGKPLDEVLDEAQLYPQSDGKPMSESTEQYRWIVFFKENLEILLAAYSSVFIAADLMWYPEKVSTPPAPRQAPDVMVIFGRPKGKRRSYQQWKEDNVAPQLVFEILSASNKTREGEMEMAYKFDFYERYGVEEYYIYDPDEFTLEGWLRQGQQLTPIHPMRDWISPRLGIRMLFQPGQDLQVYYPDGRSFLTTLELREQADRAELAATQAQLLASQAQLAASHARQQAEAERQNAAAQRQNAEAQRQNAEAERQNAAAQRQRAETAEAALAAQRESMAQMALELAHLRALSQPEQP